MVDVLTQEQIDALLAAANEDSSSLDELKQEETKRKIKVYDFKRPDKFSKDRFARCTCSTKVLRVC